MQLPSRGYGTMSENVDPTEALLVANRVQQQLRDMVPFVEQIQEALTTEGVVEDSSIIAALLCAVVILGIDKAQYVKVLSAIAPVIKLVEDLDAADAA